VRIALDQNSPAANSVEDQLVTRHIILERHSVFSDTVESSKSFVGSRHSSPSEFMPTVLIIDCISSIGLASAKLFSAIGWNVIATKRSRDIQIDLAQNEHLWVTHLDVCDQNEIKSTIEEGVKRFGNIGVLVINAVHHQIGLLEGIPRQKYNHVFEINVLGAVDTIRSIMPFFRHNHCGVIIVVISRPDHTFLPTLSSVYASNFALEGFLQAFAPEAASQGVIVKLVVQSGGISEAMIREHGRTHLTDCLLTEYHDFIEISEDMLTKNRLGFISSDEVARTIYNAATDGKSALRYIVGADNGMHHRNPAGISGT